MSMLLFALAITRLLLLETGILKSIVRQSEICLLLISDNLFSHDN